jgi:hypothetical protein
MNTKFSESTQFFFQLTKRMSSRETMVMRHSGIESLLTEDCRELARKLFEEHADLRDPGDVGNSITGADGIKRTHKRSSERKLISLFGEITIKRLGYGARGCSSLYPKDAALNLPSESYSHGIRKLVAQEAAKGSFNEVINTIKQTSGVVLPRTAVEMLTRKAAIDFDAFYKQQSAQEASHTQPPLLILTTDGKGIVMREQDLREATRIKAEQAKGKLKKRQSKGEKSNSKRMATVAAVYSIDKFVRTPEQIINEMNTTDPSVVRPRPIQKRIWASIAEESKKVTEDMFEEALRRDSKKAQKWVCLVDGDPRQLKRVQAVAKQKEVQLVIIMDIIHVIEYLWKAARVFYSETSLEGERWVCAHLLSILRGKAGQVAASMRRSATWQKKTQKERLPVEKCAGYLLKNKAYLRYNSYLKEGFPIATGVIEGACRHLIKDRMDVTGARWSLLGAEAIVKLRSIRSSGDFERYWQFHEDQEFIRNHQSHYADLALLDKCLKSG